jgi:putative redox protein
MVNIVIQYQGDLRCVATHGPSEKQLTTDAPVDNQGKGESFSPTDLVATGLGTCMATIMGIFAKRHEIDLAAMKIKVSKVMSTDAPRRIAELITEIHVPLPRSHPQREALERAALTCPVHHSLHPDIKKPVTFHWMES